MAHCACPDMPVFSKASNTSLASAAMMPSIIGLRLARRPRPTTLNCFVHAHLLASMGDEGAEQAVRGWKHLVLIRS